MRMKRTLSCILILFLLCIPSLTEANVIVDTNSVTLVSSVTLRGGADVTNLYHLGLQKDKYLILAEGTSGIEIFDAEKSQIVASIDSPVDATNAKYNISCLAFNGNTLYAKGVIGSSARLLVYDITDLTHPVPVKFPDNPDGVSVVSFNGSNDLDMAAAGNTLFITAQAYGLRIVDITNPTNPVLLRTISVGGAKVQAVEARGNYAYVGTASSVAIFDATSPANITAPISILTDNTAKGMTTSILAGSRLTLSGNYLYTILENRTSVDGYSDVIDISDSTKPHGVGRIFTYNPGDSTKQSFMKYGAVFDNVLYMVRGSGQTKNPVYPIDVSDPANPVFSWSTNFIQPHSASKQIGAFFKVGDKFWGYYYQSQYLDSFTIDAKGVAITSIANNASVTEQLPLNISGTSVGIDKVQLTIGKKTPIDLDVAADGTWNYQITDIANGNYDIKANVKGNTGTVISNVYQTKNVTVNIPVPVEFGDMNISKSMLEPGLVTASVSAKNNTSQQKDVMIVMVLFNGEDLIDANYQSIILAPKQPNGNMSVSLDIPADIDLKICKLEIFRWESWQTAKPLIKSEILLPKVQ